MLGKTVALIQFCLAAFSLAAHAEEPEIPTVTVTAAKEASIKKVDKTIHDVSNLARASNGSAQDVLQATPELSVAADGQISVRGNAQVTVLVDGKPSAMMSGEGRAVALQTMSGADIAGIEVITNPSAAYNANGGAIVNIVLKRNRKPGVHAQVRGSDADHGLWNAGVSGDATGKDVGVHGNLALRRDGTLKLRGSATDWNDTASGQSGRALQSSEVFVRRIAASAALGADYALNGTDSISLTGTLSLTVNANDIFDGSRRTTSTDTATFRQSAYDHFVARRIYLGLVHKIE